MLKSLIAQAATTVVAVCAFLAVDAWALTEGEVSDTDPRTRFFRYHPEQTYALTGYYGYVTILSFREDERIISATIGDSQAWEATPTDGRDMIFLKPVREDASTNMVIVTNYRTYAFQLASASIDDGDDLLTYKVRFIYEDAPVPDPDAVAAAEAARREALAAERAAEAARRAAEEARAQAALERAQAEEAARRAEREARWRSPSVIFDESGDQEEGRETRGPRDLGESPGRYYDSETGVWRDGVAPEGGGGGQGGARFDGVFTDDRRFLDLAGARAQGDDGLVDVAYAAQIDDPSTKLLQGATIEGVLETAIHSDLTGMVRATVATPAWSADGSRMLIQPGSRLIGTYSNSIQLGQTRVLIVWNRVITPEGVSITIDSPGTDRLGRAGLGGDVDTHFDERFGAAALISIIGGATAYGVAQTGEDVNDAASGVGDSFRQSTSATLDAYANIQPTIHVDQGARIAVFLRRDLDFSRLGAQ